MHTRRIGGVREHLCHRTPVLHHTTSYMAMDHLQSIRDRPPSRLPRILDNHHSHWSSCPRKVLYGDDTNQVQRTLPSPRQNALVHQVRFLNPKEFRFFCRIPYCPVHTPRGRHFRFMCLKMESAPLPAQTKILTFVSGTRASKLYKTINRICGKNLAA